MSGEKRAMDKASWEFTVGLLAGILIGTGIVQDAGRVAESWRKALCVSAAHSTRSFWEHENGHTCVIIVQNFLMFTTDQTCENLGKLNSSMGEF